jgi:hypothetical protein
MDTRKIFVDTFHMAGFRNCFFNPSAGVTIGGEVFVGDGVLFINDRHRRAPRQPPPPAASRKNAFVQRLYSPCDLCKRKFMDRGITAGKTLSTNQYLLGSFRDRGRFVRHDVTSFELFNSLGHVANIDGNNR